MTTTIPASIDQTGQEDVSRPLEEFFAGLKAGTQVEAPEGARYRCEGGLNIVGADRLTLDMQGAALFADTIGDEVEPSPLSAARHWPRHRAHLRLVDATECRIENHRVEGPHADAGPDGEYDPALEAQHAVELSGGEGNWIEAGSGGNVWGDFLYLGGGVRGTVVCGGDWEGASRQGTAVTHAVDTIIYGFKGRRIRRSAIDIEPAVDRWTVANTHIEATDLRDFRLTWFANLGAGVVSGVKLVDNVADRLNVIARAGSGGRRSDYGLHGNVACRQWSHGGGSPMQQYRGIDGLDITDNYAEYKDVHGDPADAVAIEAVDCTDVTHADNRFPITKFRSRTPTGDEARIVVT